MGKRDSLTCREKRDLLNKSTVAVEQLLGWAKRFEENGLINDAADFYIKAGAVSDLERLAEAMRAEGDFFLFRLLRQASGHEPNREEWLDLAEKAEAAGKFAYAIQAYRQAGEEEHAERLAGK